MQLISCGKELNISGGEGRRAEGISKTIKRSNKNIHVEKGDTFLSASEKKMFQIKKHF